MLNQSGNLFSGIIKAKGGVMTSKPIMNDKADEVICDCSGTTRGKIISLVEQGIVDMDTISRKTGAITGCGSCDHEIEILLDELVV
jgi:bacterioferritin-associated ferredoxin